MGEFEYTPLDPQASYAMPGEECPWSPVPPEPVTPSRDASFTDDGSPNETRAPVCPHKPLPDCPNSQYDNVFYEVTTIGVARDGNTATFRTGTLPTTFNREKYRPMSLAEILDYQRSHPKQYQSVCARAGEPHLLGVRAMQQIAVSSEFKSLKMTLEEAVTVFAWLMGSISFGEPGIQGDVGQHGIDPSTVAGLEVFWVKKDRAEEMLRGLARLKQVLVAEETNRRASTTPFLLGYSGRAIGYWSGYSVLGRSSDLPGGGDLVSRLNPRGLPTNISIARLDAIIHDLQVIRDAGTAFSLRGFIESQIHGSSSAFWFGTLIPVIGYIAYRIGKGKGGGGGGGHGGGGGGMSREALLAMAIAMSKAMVEAQGRTPPADPGAVKRAILEVAQRAQMAAMAAAEAAMARGVQSGTGVNGGSRVPETGHQGVDPGRVTKAAKTAGKVGGGLLLLYGVYKLARAVAVSFVATPIAGAASLVVP